MRRRFAVAALAILAATGLSACDEEEASGPTITDSGLVLEEGELPPITTP